MSLETLTQQEKNAKLYQACEANNRQEVEQLLIANAEVNGRDCYVNTPLYVAAMYGHTTIVALLLQHNADVNARGINTETPLHVAALNGYTRVAELLLERNADINLIGYFDKETPLRCAALNGHTSMVELLLQHNADVNARGGANNEAPLHGAAKNGDTTMMVLLLQYNADVNARGMDTETPLHVATLNGNITVAELLLKYKADVNIKGCYNNTPLHYAVKQNNLELVVKMLKVYEGKPYNAKFHPDIEIIFTSCAVKIMSSVYDGAFDEALKELDDKMFVKYTKPALNRVHVEEDASASNGNVETLDESAVPFSEDPSATTYYTLGQENAIDVATSSAQSYEVAQPVEVVLVAEDSLAPGMAELGM